MKSFEMLKRYWTIPLLTAIMLLALYLRIGSLRFEHIPDIDVYYFIRHAQTLLENNFILPSIDVLRYYPTGIDPHSSIMGASYIPAILYAILSKLVTIDFITYAKWIPAIFGTALIIPLYLIGKELKDKIAGVIAAFVYTVLPAVMFRTSSGEFEKEPFSLLFLLTATLYFIRAYKHESFFYGTIGGAATLLSAMIWGGTQQVYLAMGGVVGLLILMDKIDRKILAAYIPFVVFVFIGDVGKLAKGSTTELIGYLLLAVIGARYLVEKRKLVKEENLKYFGIVVASSGIILGLIGSLFSSKVATLMSDVKSFLYYEHGVIASTVAEQAPGTWHNFTSLMGFGPGITAFQQFLADATGMGLLINPLFVLVKTIGTALPLWLLTFAGILWVVYHSTKSDTLQNRWIARVSALASILLYASLLKGGSSVGIQTAYILSMMITTAMVLRGNVPTGIMLFLLYSAMLSYLPYIRLLIIVGIYATFIIGYLASDIIKKLYSAHIHFSKKENPYVRYVSMALLILLAVTFTLSYTAPGYGLGMQLGPSYNDNWEEAMTFMREQTPEESVILSWWDFGYWFQLKAERATNLDGGNEFSDRNIPTAQFFTGMLNESKQKFFLEKMGTTHLLVDASMIGKYSAMSKIANHGKKIDSYLFIPYTQSRKTQGGNVLIYSNGYYTVLVPVVGNGSISAPKLVAGGGEAYISRLCLPDKIVNLPVPKNASVADVCVMLTQNEVILLSNEIASSVFHNLFFLDGQSIEYVTKVFDNGEVKIYEIDPKQVPRLPKEELQEWWATHTSENLTVG